MVLPDMRPGCLDYGNHEHLRLASCLEGDSQRIYFGVPPSPPAVLPPPPATTLTSPPPLASPVPEPPVTLSPSPQLASPGPSPPVTSPLFVPPSQQASLDPSPPLSSSHPTAIPQTAPVVPRVILPIQPAVGHSCQYWCNQWTCQSLACCWRVVHGAAAQAAELRLHRG